MSNFQKSFSTCLFATAALLVGASPAWAQVPLGAASGFSVLGGTNVTCTAGAVAGDVGVSPGGAIPFTNTGCTIAGATPCDQCGRSFSAHGFPQRLCCGPVHALHPDLA